MPNPQPSDPSLTLSVFLCEELIARDFSKRELAVILFVLLESWANGKHFATLEAWQDFRAAGILKPHINETVSGLIQKRVLLYVQRGKAHHFMLNKHFELWDVPQKAAMVNPINRIEELWSLNAAPLDAETYGEIKKALLDSISYRNSNNTGPVTETVIGPVTETVTPVTETVTPVTETVTKPVTKTVTEGPQTRTGAIFTNKDRQPPIYVSDHASIQGLAPDFVKGLLRGGRTMTQVQNLASERWFEFAKTNMPWLTIAPYIVDTLARYRDADDAGMEDEILLQALKIALERKGPGVPVRYITGILNKWAALKITTMAQLQQYELSDAAGDDARRRKTIKLSGTEKGGGQSEPELKPGSWKQRMRPPNEDTE